MSIEAPVCTCAIIDAGTKWEYRLLNRSCPVHGDRTERVALRDVTRR